MYFKKIGIIYKVGYPQKAQCSFSVDSLLMIIIIKGNDFDLRSPWAFCGTQILYNFCANTYSVFPQARPLDDKQVVLGNQTSSKSSQHCKVELAHGGGVFDMERVFKPDQTK